MDVGANSPHDDSVTKLFYDLGWKGINIEPITYLHDQLQEARPNDINLPILVGQEAKDITFCEIISESHGLSTANSEEIKKLQERQLPFKTYSVKQKTLDQVFEEYNVSLVSFLKIDVEGNEKEVLEGITLSKNRPIVIVVESTFPCTMTPSYQDWEHIITENDYVFALSSVINRYYVRKENPEYLARFALAGRIMKMLED
ncbi:FkbM family methyltransferase [Candidatus Finniella inopinata]|uniref:FkbM family methyltransferase n=1 Tax=Candidatus Finniella inopinata TaxID=1696036 RepID=UPI001F5D079F|nr:FkbM family methyltransferase [Candidatus Finniella inopinata]